MLKNIILSLIENKKPLLGLFKALRDIGYFGYGG